MLSHGFSAVEQLTSFVVVVGDLDLEELKVILVKMPNHSIPEISSPSGREKSWRRCLESFDLDIVSEVKFFFIFSTLHFSFKNFEQSISILKFYVELVSA